MKVYLLLFLEQPVWKNSSDSINSIIIREGTFERMTRLDIIRSSDNIVQMLFRYLKRNISIVTISIRLEQWNVMLTTRYGNEQQ